MSNIVVIYQSIYGNTKRYAEWISKELNADLFEKTQINEETLENYEVIIYGGGLYAGGIKGISIILKNFERIKDKKIIVFTCGLADPKDETNVKGIWKGIDKTFTTEQKEKISFFHLRGGIVYKKLSFVHKSMMAMLKRQLMKKDFDTLTDEDKQMLETYGKEVDFKDKATIMPIVEFVKNNIT